MRRVEQNLPIAFQSLLRLATLAPLCFLVMFSACHHRHGYVQSSAEYIPDPLVAAALGAADPSVADPGQLDPNAPWAPPGVERPWPKDEYLHDGGDRSPEVMIRSDGTMAGLDLEETVAQFQTEEGELLLEHSNQVSLYAPRFASVRHVTSVVENLQNDQALGYDAKIEVVKDKLIESAASHVQPVQPEAGIAKRRVSTYLAKTQDNGVSNAIALLEAEESREVRENVVEDAVETIAQRQQAFTAEAIQAALIWSHDKAVQVVINHEQAVALNADTRAEAVFTVDRLPGRTKLKLTKRASTSYALPGDTVDFTLRYRNTGDQSIGSLVIVDNLTTRLEYVADSSDSDRTAKLSSAANEGDSLLLRWEIEEPLRPGEEGEIRFRCTVR